MVHGEALELICREKAQNAHKGDIKNIPILRFLRFLAAKVCQLDQPFFAMARQKVIFLL